MADQEDLIQQFKAITQENSDSRAKFFLETANWQLDLAMTSYYDNDGADMMDTEEMAQIQPNAQSESPVMSAGASSDFDKDDGLEAWMRTAKNNPASSSKTKEEKPKPKASSKFASLSDYTSAPPPPDSDEEEGQSYYAGGSEHSGELIVGPNKKKKDIVEQMFKDAKKHGAESVDKSREERKKPTTSSSHFSGGGYKLGETDSDHQFIAGQEKAKERKLDIVLKLWSNGFTTSDDGPLRDFKDPENKEFLDHIRKGEIPPELTKMAKGGVVNLDMEDHRNEEFKQPKKKVQAFSGAGHKLGSPAPVVVQNTPIVQQTSSVDPEVIVDHSQPTTTIQIRLADGTKVTQKFNHSHTVADIRNLMISRNPQSGSRSFVLMTTFPNKELTDMTTSIKDANLLNTVIIQRYK